MLVRGEEDASKGTNAENLRLRVDMVVLLKLMHTLLLISLSRLDIRSLDSLLGRSAVFRCCGVKATHSNLNYNCLLLRFQ